MASTANTTQTLNGLFKEVYGDKIKNLIPDGVKLLNKIDFTSKDKQTGNLFHQPVVLGLEHGVTFAGSDDGAFNLNAPIAGQIKDAQVQGNQMVLRSVLSYSAASRAAGGSPRAFQDSTKFLVSNMVRSVARKLEVELLYGQVGYGTVASTSVNTVTVTTADWAPGIWSGAENMVVEFRDTTGATSRGEATITSVDLDARTITVDALPGGVVGTDVIWHKGAYGNEFAGIHKIVTNTGSLFNISASSYGLWKGNTFGAGSAALTLAKVQKGIAKAVAKGLDSDITCMVNPSTWTNLISDEAALRSYDQSYNSKLMENGAKSIKFHSQNGMIEVEPSIYVKEGFAYGLAMDELMRVGSTDVTFKRPGYSDEFFKDLESSAGYELRAYTDQALFCSAPGKLVLFNAIVNS